MIDASRVGRIIRRIHSRWGDYSGLHAASSVDEAIGWAERHETRMLNGGALRAKIVEALFRATPCNVFLETGTSHAATTIGIRRFLGVPVMSCEVSKIDYLISRIITAGMPGITLFNMDSREFLSSIIPELRKRNEVPFIYLDAHEGRIDSTSLPLEDEIMLLQGLESFVVMIDDFKIPWDSGFMFGSYGSRCIGIDLVRSVLKEIGISSLYLPGFAAHKESGFVTGFCIFWKTDTRGVQDMGHFPLNLLKEVVVERG